MINMSLINKGGKKQLGDLRPGAIFVINAKGAKDGDVYAKLNQSYLNTYLDFKAANITGPKVFAVHLNDGVLEYFDAAMRVIELNSAELSYRV